MENKEFKRKYYLVIILFILSFTFISRFVNTGFKLIYSYRQKGEVSNLILALLSVMHFVGMLASAILYSRFKNVRLALIVSGIITIVFSLFTIILPYNYNIISFVIVVFISGAIIPMFGPYLKSILKDNKFGLIGLVFGGHYTLDLIVELITLKKGINFSNVFLFLFFIIFLLILIFCKKSLKPPHVQKEKVSLIMYLKNSIIFFHLLLINTIAGLLSNIYQIRHSSTSSFVVIYKYIPLILSFLLIYIIFKKDKGYIPIKKQIYNHTIIALFVLSFIIYFIGNGSGMGIIFMSISYALTVAYTATTAIELTNYNTNSVLVFSIGTSANMAGVYGGHYLGKWVQTAFSTQSFMILFLSFIIFILIAFSYLESYIFRQLKIIRKIKESKISKNEKQILTSREQDVYILILEGDSNATIAEKLFISENTVKSHLKKIYSKLEVNSRTEIMARKLNK